MSIMNPEAQGGFDTRGLMMLYTDPPKHTRYRRLVSKGFTPRMIGLIEQYLRNRSRLIVDNVIERGECDFVVDLASELPLQAIAEIMGVPQEDRRLIFEWSNRMIGADDPEFEGGAEGAHEASAALYMYANDLAKQRRSDPRDDIVTKLINAEIDGEQLSELEFDMFMLLLAVAGNETTRNTTAWGMWALMQHPEQYAHAARRPRHRAQPGDRGDPALGIARVPLPPHRHRGTEIHGQRDRRGRQGRDVVHLGQPRRDRVRRPVPLRHRRVSRRSRSRSAAAATTSAWAPTSPAWSCTSSSRRCCRASPTCTSSPTPTCCAPTSSAASSTCRWSTPRAREIGS